MPVSDDVLVARLKEVLKNADFEKTTEKMIRKSLEEEFGEDLTEKKLMIRQQIEEFLSEQQGEDDEEDDEESEEEAAPAKGNKLGSMLSPALAEFLGVESLPRTQVVKRLWEYIREHNLQDPKNKRRILLDEKLQTIFTPPLDMFTMNKQLSKHVYTNDADHAGPSKPKAAAKPKPKSEKRAAGEKQQSQRGSKKQKREGGSNPNNAFSKPLMLSEELAAFVGQPAMARGQVTKFFWSYYKEHGLQDPRDGRNILCDDKLQALLKVKSFQAFSLARLLKGHFGDAASGEVAAAAVAAAQAAEGPGQAAANGDGGSGEGSEGEEEFVEDEAA